MVTVMQSLTHMHSVFKLHKALSVNILWEKRALATAIMVEHRPWTKKNGHILNPKHASNFVSRIYLFIMVNFCYEHNTYLYQLTDCLLTSQKFSESWSSVENVTPENFKIFILFLKVFASNYVLEPKNVTIPVCLQQKRLK